MDLSLATENLLGEPVNAIQDDQAATEMRGFQWVRRIDTMYS